MKMIYDFSHEKPSIITPGEVSVCVCGGGGGVLGEG